MSKHESKESFISRLKGRFTNPKSAKGFNIDIDNPLPIDAGIKAGVFIYSRNKGTQSKDIRISPNGGLSLLLHTGAAVKTFGIGITKTLMKTGKVFGNGIVATGKDVTDAVSSVKENVEIASVQRKQTS